MLFGRVRFQEHAHTHTHTHTHTHSPMRIRRSWEPKSALKREENVRPIATESKKRKQREKGVEKCRVVCLLGGCVHRAKKLKKPKTTTKKKTLVHTLC